MDSRKLAQDIYTQAIYNSREIGRVQFGNCECQFNIANEFGISEESAKNVIVYLYRYVKYDYIHDFDDVLEQDAFDMLSWYVRRLCMCGSTCLNINDNNVVMTIDGINRDILLSLDVSNKVYLCQICMLSSKDTDKYFNININKYFDIKNDEYAKYYLKSAYDYCTSPLFLDEYTNEDEEHIVHAISYAIISPFVKHYDIDYHNDSIIVRVKEDSMK